MASSVVERATSSMLIGPDWALNMEICDMLNRDPGQVKEVVKVIKRRLGSKKPKVQVLNLTLLETIVKNCGDIVQMHVADKGLLREMVKIVKKKPDYQVKEKILYLIDAWQEEFGGPRARYPQYFAAYQELLHAGAVFPRRSERGAPVLTPLQSHPLSSYSHKMQNSGFDQRGMVGSSADGQLHTLSLSEIQKVRGSVDVLSEMLSAIQPGSKEALRQEALIDLVEQCRTCKPKVVHLVNSTVDESMLCQGLALNDELQRVLAKYESVLSAVSVQVEKPKPEPAKKDHAIVESPSVDEGESSNKADRRSTSEATALTPVSLYAPPAATGTPTPPKVEAKMDLLNCDLLGGDDYSAPTENSLAIVPISAPQPASPVATDQNALALFDLLSTGSNPPNASNGPPAFVDGSEFQQQQRQHSHPQQGPLQQNGLIPNMVLLHEQTSYQQVTGLPWGAQSVQPQQQQQQPPPLYQNGISPFTESSYEQSSYTQISGSSSWGAQTAQQMPSTLQQNGTPPTMGGSVPEQSGYPQTSGPSWGAQSHVQLKQQPSSPVYGAQNGCSMPPPPWESQSTDIQPFGAPFSSTTLISKMGPHSPRIHALGVPTPANEHQIVGMFVQPITGGQLMALNQSFQIRTIYTQPMQGSQMMNMLSQTMQSPTQMTPQQMYTNQMISYGQEPQYLEQGMYGLSLKGGDTTALSLPSGNPSQMSCLPPVKQQPKASDLLFGDLVDIAKVKPTKFATGANGSM